MPGGVRRSIFGGSAADAELSNTSVNAAVVQKLKALNGKARVGTEVVAADDESIRIPNQTNSLIGVGSLTR